MIAKTYGIFDSVQQEYVQTFTCSNDADAVRTADKIVRTPNFDDISYKDRSIHHLFDVDTASGKIIDNEIRQVFNFSTAIEARKREELEKSVNEKLLTDEFKSELKDFIINNLVKEIHDDKRKEN